jgi:hypothetical protein
MAEFWRNQHDEKISFLQNENKMLNPQEFAYNKKFLEEMNLINPDQEDFSDFII